MNRFTSCPQLIGGELASGGGDDCVTKKVVVQVCGISILEAVDEQKGRRRFTRTKPNQIGSYPSFGHLICDLRHDDGDDWNDWDDDDGGGGDHTSQHHVRDRVQYCICTNLGVLACNGVSEVDD